MSIYEQQHKRRLKEKRLGLCVCVCGEGALFRPILRAEKRIELSSHALGYALYFLCYEFWMNKMSKEDLEVESSQMHDVRATHFADFSHLLDWRELQVILSSTFQLVRAFVPPKNTVNPLDGLMRSMLMQLFFIGLSIKLKSVNPLAIASKIDDINLIDGPMNDHYIDKSLSIRWFGWQINYFDYVSVILKIVR